MRTFKFGKKIITQESNPYVIAEIGVNHEGIFEKAIELIDLAVKGGADAVKFQSYKAHKLASKHSPSYWDRTKEPTGSQYELFQKYDSFEPEDYVKLFEYCKTKNVDFLSTPFDAEAVDFLNPLCDLYKIASADLTNTPFLRQIGGTKKPVILSTGASSLNEIREAVATLKTNGCTELCLLHCVLNYPTVPKNAHLNMIKSLMDEFPDLLIGYSDHVKPDESLTVLTTAYLKGARIIEKHFTHDKNLMGNDHYHAMDYLDIQKFTKQIEYIKELEGESVKRALEVELPAISNARRSIVLKSKLTLGQTISEKDLTYKRPGTGISPLHWDDVIGKKAKVELDEDHVLKWEDIY